MHTNFISILQFGPDRYRPDPAYGAAPFNTKFFAASIGAIAFLIPVVALIGTQLGLCDFDSVSHYYYAPVVGDLFVGYLFAVAALLFGYRGQHASEAVLARWAGVFALGVALLPTREGGCQDPSFTARTLVDWVQSPQGPVPTGATFNTLSLVGNLHFVSAGLLFVLLAFYAGFVFTRPTPGHDPSAPSQNKIWRNRIYVASAVVIVTAIVVLGGRAGYLALTGEMDDPTGPWRRGNLTFWFEAAALAAFGVSWLIKGRLFFGFLEDPDPKRTSEA
ncbi:MAG: hypothetical protein AAGA78_04255 [Pseudomonadota bacterium]